MGWKSGVKNGSGITEKRLKNKRFYKTESAILRAFFEDGGCVSLDKMARQVGVARSTIYHHHQAIKEIIPDYKRYILRKYSNTINCVLRRKRVNMRNVYMQMLIFIIINRKIFLIFSMVGDKDVMMVMIDKLRAGIERYARLPKNSEKIFYIYRGEVLAILDKWSRDKYNEAEIEVVLNDIMYLTRTMRQRLKGFLN